MVLHSTRLQHKEQAHGLPHIPCKNAAKPPGYQVPKLPTGGIGFISSLLLGYSSLREKAHASQDWTFTHKPQDFLWPQCRWPEQGQGAQIP